MSLTLSKQTSTRTIRNGELLSTGLLPLFPDKTLIQTGKKNAKPRIVSSIKAQRTEREKLHARYAEKLSKNSELSRALVSFQGNKAVPFYRWFKYREGFASELVTFLLTKFRPPAKRFPKVLDPFAGAGTTLTTATKAGWKAVGIELLPVGAAAIRARLASDKVNLENFKAAVALFKTAKPGAVSASGYKFPHLGITEMAFSPETESELGAFLNFANSLNNKTVWELFRFACLSVLEDISFTRKDGQYLRWDVRSGRQLRSKKNFKKAAIRNFRDAIIEKLDMMSEDICARNGGTFSRNAKVIEGSCLSALPRLQTASFDLILTSPPYCNRYDYTRTYALELAFLGCNENSLKNLRQSLLSCTVENKSKRVQLREAYRRLGRASFFTEVEEVFDGQVALQEVLKFLEAKRNAGELNNDKIPNLVENYFFEMNLVIHEFGRILTKGGVVTMVNDNVQYCGEEVPVDLILSDFANHAGMNTAHIWVLPKGKGNSSQQMGEHGRNEIRKCVYVWEKARGRGN